MKNKITQKDILYFSVSMFIIVAAWVGFNIFHTYVSSTISEDLKLQIIPIKPEFDTAAIQGLKKRESANPIFEKTAVVTATPAAEITPEPEIPLVTKPIPTETPIITNEPLPTEEPTPTI